MNEVFVNGEYLLFFHLKRIYLTKNETGNIFFTKYSPIES